MKTVLRNAGRRQEVEHEFAQYAQESPLAIETTARKHLTHAVLDLFRQLESRSAKLYS